MAPQVTLVQKVAPQVTLSRPGDGRISAKGADLVAISQSGSYDVPATAMRAYKNAAAEMASIRPKCQIPWTLLAGIGRVESDHGRYGGSVLGVDGLPRPSILGVALNGVGPVAAIADSDDGRWDDDKVWDRAVGPMQFIPTTWESAGRDGDGDGVSNPNDIDDAALAAADYLCPSSGSVLSDRHSTRRSSATTTPTTTSTLVMRSRPATRPVSSTCPRRPRWWRKPRTRRRTRRRTPTRPRRRTPTPPSGATLLRHLRRGRQHRRWWRWWQNRW